MTPEKHIVGFDYARAIFSIFVVLWHTHSLAQPTLWTVADAAHYRPTAIDLLNYYVLLLAVPFFITMSCYLFIAQGGGLSRLRRRVERLLALALFWSIATLVFNDGRQGLLHGWQLIRGSPLVYASQSFGTIYYFFVALTLTLVWCEAVNRLRTAYVWLVALLTCGVVVFFNWETAVHSSSWTSAFWSPLNYVAFVPTIILFVRHRDSIMRRPWVFSVCALVLCAAISLVEWRTLVGKGIDTIGIYGFPEYMRISMLCMCMAMLPIFLSIKRRPGRIIAYASAASLSLYCLHPFIIMTVRTFYEGTISPPIIEALVGILGSYLVAEILRRSVLRPSLLSA